MRVRIALVVLLVAAAGLVAGCGGDDADSGAATTTQASATTSTATTGATTAAAEPAECLTSGQPDPGTKPSFTKPEQVLTPGKDAVIVMRTSCGTLRIKLDPTAGGPIPNSIAFLASEGFYDGLTFHRVVPDFVLQGGDPLGNGTGGPGYQVEGPVPAGYTYKVGDVAMAKTQADPPGTAGSQFFVVSGAQGESILTSQPVYGILGRATDPASLATIKRIAALAVSDGPPSTPVWIISADLRQGT